MKNGKTNAFISQNVLLKAFGHKYIRRIPKKSGKGFWYIYAETFKKPFQALAQIFGIRKKTISENYVAHDIKRDYGVNEKTYAAHVLEYFTNRDKWDALFAKEENRKKYSKPRKPAARTGGKKTGAGKKRSGGEKKKKPTDDAIRVNRSLMYHVWKTYGGGIKEVAVENDAAEMAVRKEAALERIREAGAKKERLREEDIDWDAIEDGTGAAKEVITKANIFGQVDWARLKKRSMTGGAAYLIDKVYEAIADAPQEDSAESRMAYVIGVNGLRDRLEKARTESDVMAVLNEISGEKNGAFISFEIESEPDYEEQRAKVKEAEEKLEEADKKADELIDQVGKEQLAKPDRVVELVKPFLTENGATYRGEAISENSEISGGWGALYGIRDRLPFDKQDEFWQLVETADREADEYFAELKRRRDEAIKAVDAARAERDKAQSEFRAWAEQREKEKRKDFAFDNPLARPWAELGEKFGGIADGGDKSFNSHWADAKRGEHDRWEWAEKHGIEAGESPPLPAEMEEIAEKTERIGGDDISAKSTTEIREMFNLRDIFYGSWVADDLPTAQWHVRRAAEGFADLAGVTGIPRELISLNGRVSLAIGLRDKSDSLAHYELLTQVINMNKTNGAGSLAHEWFHAFDNLIMDAMGGNKGRERFFMTNKFFSLSEKQATALKNYLEAPEGSDEKSRARAICEERGITVPETPTEEHQIKVAAAFEELKKAMMEGTGNTTVNLKIMYGYNDEFDAKQRIRPGKKGIGGAIYSAGNFDDAAKAIYEKSKSDKERVKWLKLAAAYYKASKPLKWLGVSVKVKSKESGFLMSAKALDAENSGQPWATPHEMGARAFEAYVKDKLAEQGRRNDYLAKNTSDNIIFPEGEERKRINAAFDKLFRVIAETNAIRKALIAVAGRKSGKAGKRWLWVDGDGKIWVKKSVLKVWKKAMAE